MQTGFSEPLFTQQGEDAPFAEVLGSGKLPKGKNSKIGVTGSKIDVKWKRGAWHQWSGTYTIIKPYGAAIFQAKNAINDWSVQINMNAAGDVVLNHRRAEDKVIATGMVGKPFHIRVRDNGHDYEVYLNGSKVGEGFYARPEGESGFRWGMYLGGKSKVKQDAMIFVSGATVDGKGSK